MKVVVYFDHEDLEALHDFLVGALSRTVADCPTLGAAMAIREALRDNAALINLIKTKAKEPLKRGI